jgi:hypothetical protein
VLILTQASIVLDVGPAMAGIAARSEAAQTPEAARVLRENMETSAERSRLDIFPFPESRSRRGSLGDAEDFRASVQWGGENLSLPAQVAIARREHATDY